MARQFRMANRVRYLFVLLVCSSMSTGIAYGQATASPQPLAAYGCRVEAVDYRGWRAQQLSNRWVQLILLPQNGGRLIQMSFAGHPYLFVNPKYEGKYFPPASHQWFNYGGDKLWLLPEGNKDEQHWVGDSDLIDDGPFSFRKLSEGKDCEIELTGPADPQTGIQFLRTIRINSDSPQIQFHATMKNVTGHSLEWSMQSVSQYDTADSGDPARINHNFWTFTPANQTSNYLNRYHVRFGPAENPAVWVRDDGLFSLHYVHMAAELWLDSTDGWLAVVDGGSQYAMVERFRYEENKSYPGKASVIFWMNGPELKVNSDGMAVLSGGEEGKPPYYLEAEINSPLCRLRPGETCSFDTEWFPTRARNEFHGVTDAGILIRPLRATRTQDGKIRLSGAFGVFFPGHLVARLYDEHGASLGKLSVADVNPTEGVSVETEISPNAMTNRLALHLEDGNGVDRGLLQEVQVTVPENR
jgi:hypothetical protein